MNIFAIALLSFLCALVVFLVYALVLCCMDFNVLDETKLWLTGVVVSFILFVISVFVSISLNTNAEKVYIERYKAQKETIEQSLSSDALSGLERIELVNKAVDINGEVAARKAKSKLWYYVYTDKHIYDNVELIDLD